MSFRFIPDSDQQEHLLPVVTQEQLTKQEQVTKLANITISMVDNHYEDYLKYYFDGHTHFATQSNLTDKKLNDALNIYAPLLRKYIQESKSEKIIDTKKLEEVVSWCEFIMRQKRNCNQFNQPLQIKEEAKPIETESESFEGKKIEMIKSEKIKSKEKLCINRKNFTEDSLTEDSLTEESLSEGGFTLALIGIEDGFTVNGERLDNLTLNNLTEDSLTADEDSLTEDDFTPTLGSGITMNDGVGLDNHLTLINLTADKNKQLQSNPMPDNVKKSHRLFYSQHGQTLYPHVKENDDVTSKYEIQKPSSFRR